MSLRLLQMQERVRTVWLRRMWWTQEVGSRATIVGVEETRSRVECYLHGYFEVPFIEKQKVGKT